MLPRTCISRLFHTDQRLQLTLAMIKPDASSSPYVVQRIRDIILRNNFYVVRTKQCKLTLDEAKEFYHSHSDKFFYNRLITFMSSGPIYAHLLAQNNAIDNWRKLMGPTKTYRAQHEDPESIRGQFGLTDTRNAVHGSDSLEAVIREAKFFFSEFDISQWDEEEEQFFRTSQIVLDKNLFEHRIVKTAINENLRI